MAATDKYVVTANFLGTLTRGDVVAEGALPADAKMLLKDGSIRRATSKESESDATWVDEPHRTEAATAPTGKGGKRGPGGRFTRKEAAANAAASAPASATPSASSTPLASDEKA